MTLREVIQTGLIKDIDPIKIRKITYADTEMIKNGNWFHDHILEDMDMRVVKMRYVCAVPGTAIWEIDLDQPEEERK